MLASTDRVTAAILIIGDEILSGRTQDTNLRDIAKYFGAHGVDIAEARVVGDIEAEIVTTLNHLRERYDYVVTTGGIGPTHDDITADCVALAFGVKLHEHPEIIEMMTARWQGELTPARRRMARVPEGGTLVKNPVNGPPGFQIGNVFVLAGVPQIMRGMLEDIGHRLKGGAVVISMSIRIDGTGEGVLAAPLEAVAKAHPEHVARLLSLLRAGRIWLQPGDPRAGPGGSGRRGGGIDGGAGGGRREEHQAGRRALSPTFPSTAVRAFRRTRGALR